MKTNKQTILRITGIGLFTAIVIVLQFLGSFIKLGIFSISLVLLPIVIGAAMYGIGAGGWLGFVFGVTVLISGDAAAFLAINIPGTVITVLAKGTLAGLAAGATYNLLNKLLKNKLQFVSTLAAAVVCPVVNTGVFLLGCLAFFMDTICEWALMYDFGDNVALYMIVGLVGANFLAELAINLVFSPTVVQIISIGKKHFSAK